MDGIPVHTNALLCILETQGAALRIKGLHRSTSILESPVRNMEHSRG